MNALQQVNDLDPICAVKAELGAVEETLVQSTLRAALDGRLRPAVSRLASDMLDELNLDRGE